MRPNRRTRQKTSISSASRKEILVCSNYFAGNVAAVPVTTGRILRQVMAMPNVKMLLGNHELMMLEALYETFLFAHDTNEFLLEQKLRLWYRNGGKITHAFLKRLRKTVRREIFEYLESLPINIELVVEGRQYLLTHAAPLDFYLASPMIRRDAREFAVWHRFRGYEQGPEDQTVIFGHTCTQRYQAADPVRIWYGTRLIGIDCGAAYDEPRFAHRFKSQTRLACLRLDDGAEFYSAETSEKTFAGEEEHDEAAI